MNRLIMAFALVIVPGASLIANAQGNKACSLVTAAELESVLGGKVTGLSSQATGSADVQMCTANAPKARVLLRIARMKGGDGKKEAAGIEMARKMGAQVDVKTWGSITCSTFIPPKNLEAHGFNTTCTVKKGGAVAGVEITAKSRADMVPIDKLHPLAEKMAARF